MVEYQEQLKDMGILEIFTQSFKTIFKCNKILTKIALTLILPLTTIFIANMDISNRVFHYHNANPYHMLFQAYWMYNSKYHAEYADYSRHWVYFVLISIMSIGVFYICATASVVYTITSIYTGDEVKYTKSIKVVEKVWDRVMFCLVTMLMNLVLFNLVMEDYDIVRNDDTFSRMTRLVVYIFGYMCLSIVWQLASTISVLEDCECPDQVLKAMNLVTGKTLIAAFVISVTLYVYFGAVVFMCMGLVYSELWVMCRVVGHGEVLRAMSLVMGKMFIAAFMISFTVYVYFGGVVFMYMTLVVHSELLVMWRVLIGTICGVLMMFGFLFTMVVYTMLYLVCKSYKGEAIDSVHLSYLADSQPDEKPQNQPVFKV